MRHANERIYVGAETKELILCLGRIHETTYAREGVDVELRLKRRKRGIKCKKEHFHHNNHYDNYFHTWKAYSVDGEGEAHFEIPASFLIDAEKGLYDAELFMGDCGVCDMEIVKAPSFYIKAVDTADATCEKTQWVEPTCDTEELCACHCQGDPKKDCSCIHPPGGSCVGCKPKRVVLKAQINPHYSGLPI